MARPIKSAAQRTDGAEPDAELTEPDDQQVIGAGGGPNEPAAEPDDTVVAEPEPPVEHRAEPAARRVSTRTEPPTPEPPPSVTSPGVKGKAGIMRFRIIRRRLH
jgi:hypothetical protein